MSPEERFFVYSPSAIFTEHLDSLRGKVDIANGWYSHLFFGDLTTPNTIRCVIFSNEIPRMKKLINFEVSEDERRELKPIKLSQTVLRMRQWAFNFLASEVRE